MVYVDKDAAKGFLAEDRLWRSGDNYHYGISLYAVVAEEGARGGYLVVDLGKINPEKTGDPNFDMEGCDIEEVKYEDLPAAARTADEWTNFQDGGLGRTAYKFKAHPLNAVACQFYAGKFTTDLSPTHRYYLPNLIVRTLGAPIDDSRVCVRRVKSDGMGTPEQSAATCSTTAKPVEISSSQGVAQWPDQAPRRDFLLLAAGAAAGMALQSGQALLAGLLDVLSGRLCRGSTATPST